MIVTVKAWLHAQKTFDGKTVYAVHSFRSPLTKYDVMIREVDLLLEVPDDFDLDTILARDADERLQKEIENAEAHVARLKALAKVGA